MSVERLLFVMAGGAAKRSSDDCVLGDTKKKKKKTKENPDADVPKDKTTTVCNGDLRQKKAFFAYFGKTFNDEKPESSVEKNCDADNDEKKSKVKNTTTKIMVIGDDSEDHHSQTLASKDKKEIIAEKRKTSHPINTSCFIS